MPYIYSTASCSTDYAIYKKNSSRDLGLVERKITIKGGANVATKFPNIYTPKGVVTRVSDEDLAILEQDPNFIQHRDNGFLTIDKKEIEIEKVVGDMQKQDKSAPRTPDDPEFNTGKLDRTNEKTKGVSVLNKSKK